MKLVTEMALAFTMGISPPAGEELYPQEKSTIQEVDQCDIQTGDIVLDLGEVIGTLADQIGASGENFTNAPSSIAVSPEFLAQLKDEYAILLDRIYETASNNNCPQDNNTIQMFDRYINSLLDSLHVTTDPETLELPDIH